MLDIIIEVLENIITVMYVFTFFYILTLRILSPSVIRLEKNNALLRLKGYVCIFLSLQLVISSLIILLFTIYSVSKAFVDVEVDAWVCGATILFLEVFIYVATLSMLSLLWKNIYDKNIIPGDGTVKERIANIIRGLKRRTWKYE